MDNLVTACKECNGGKRAKHIQPASHPEWQTLAGKFFHTFGDDGRIARQGVVLAQSSPGVYVVQYFSWISGGGAWYGKQLVRADTMADQGWSFYATPEQMQEHLEYGGRRPFEEYVPAPDPTWHDDPSGMLRRWWVRRTAWLRG